MKSRQKTLAALDGEFSETEEASKNDAVIFAAGLGPEGCGKQ